MTVAIGEPLALGEMRLPTFAGFDQKWLLCFEPLAAKECS